TGGDPETLLTETLQTETRRLYFSPRLVSSWADACPLLSSVSPCGLFWPCCYPLMLAPQTKTTPQTTEKKRPLLQSMFLVWFSTRENFERRATFGDRLAKSDFCYLFQLSKSLFAVETIRHSFTNIFFASGPKFGVTLSVVCTGHGSLRSRH